MVKASFSHSGFCKTADYGAMAKSGIHSASGSRFVLLFGGFLGFFVAYLGGMAAGHDHARNLLHACVGCLFGVILIRGFLGVLEESLRTVRAKDRAEAQAQAEQEKANAVREIEELVEQAGEESPMAEVSANSMQEAASNREEATGG